MTLSHKLNVRWIVKEDDNTLSELAAQVLIDVLMNTARPVIGFATGGTPRKLYQHLVRKSQADQQLQRHWQDMIGFNLDEYVGLSPDHPQSYHKYMMDNLYQYLPVTSDHMYIPNGVGDLNRNCKDYDESLEFYGWPDVQILGIGANGHIGFNEPSDRLEIETHVTHLSEGTRQANALYFQDGTVPLQAITMGMGSILHAKKIILLALGSVKRQALLRAFSGTIDTRCPASFLQLHNNIIIFTDQIL